MDRESGGMKNPTRPGCCCAIVSVVEGVEGVICKVRESKVSRMVSGKKKPCESRQVGCSTDADEDGVGSQST
jgi:hypothetical protein